MANQIKTPNVQGRTPWEMMMAQLAMSSQTNPQTLAGFGVGKLLRGLFDDWKGNYDARRFINDRLAGMNEQDRAEALKTLEQYNPDQYQRTMKYLDKMGIGNISPQINSETTAQLSQQAVPKLLGDNPFSKTAVEQININPWEDEYNWNKWSTNIFGR
ncbi:MAG: hypothetical protein IJQ82_00630 [Selenomonadaceae bacterium]|nr:hypothetical protein [Selenomonadaceae bacterium]